MPFVPHIVGDDDEMDEVNGTLEPEPTPNESSAFVDSSEMDTSDSSDSSDDSDSSSAGVSDVENANAPNNNVEQKKDHMKIVFENQKDAGEEDTDDSDDNDDDNDDDDDEDDAMRNGTKDITSIVGNAQEKGIENVVLVSETENADVAAPSFPVVENPSKFRSIFDLPDLDDEDICERTPNSLEIELRPEPVEINEIMPSIENLPNIGLPNNTELVSMQSPNREISDAIDEVGVTSPEAMQQDLGPEPLQPIATVDLEPMDVEKEEKIEPETISLDSEMDEEQEMEELESPKLRSKRKPKTIQKLVDADERLSAESRRKSLRSANKFSPVATAASTKRQRPTRQRPTRSKPKANKVTKARCVGSLGKRSASDGKLARPVVVTDYFRQVSATLVENRVSLLPFIHLQKCLDELVTVAVKQTKNYNDECSNF